MTTIIIIEKLHCLRGEQRKKVYRIGDTVRVRVDRVDTGPEKDRFFAGRPRFAAPVVSFFSKSS